MMLKAKPLPLLVRVFDILLWPVMFALGGFRNDSVQETHHWHCQQIDPSSVDGTLSIVVPGDDKSTVVSNRVFPFPTFHAPLFGGWRNYAVFQAQSEAAYWHIGWIHRCAPEGSRPQSHLQTLPIYDREVRVLKQSEGFITEFFAVDQSGKQLPLRLIGEGVLGDDRYSSVRLL